MLFPTSTKFSVKKQKLKRQNFRGAGVTFYFFYFRKTLFSHLISRFMLFSKLKQNCLGNIEKWPLTYWLNGRYFLQIVDIGDSGESISKISSIPLF